MQDVHSITTATNTQRQGAPGTPCPPTTHMPRAVPHQDPAHISYTEHREPLMVWRHLPAHNAGGAQRGAAPCRRAAGHRRDPGTAVPSGEWGTRPRSRRQPGGERGTANPTMNPLPARGDAAGSARVGSGRTSRRCREVPGCGAGEHRAVPRRGRILPCATQQRRSRNQVTGLRARSGAFGSGGGSFQRPRRSAPRRPSGIPREATSELSRAASAAPRARGLGARGIENNDQSI